TVSAFSDRGKPRSERRRPDWLRRNADGLLRRGKGARRRRLGDDASARSAAPSLGQLLADRLQFALTFGARFRIAHLQPFERVEDDLGDDQVSVLLVVGAGTMYQGASLVLVALRHSS